MNKSDIKNKEYLKDFEAVKTLIKEKIPKEAKVIAIIRVGSRAYGLSTENSDVDYRVVYLQSNKDFLVDNYKPNIQVTEDIQAMELRTFLLGVYKGSFTHLEMLFSSEENILESTGEFWEILFNRYRTLSSRTRASIEGAIKSLSIKGRTPKDKHHAYRLRLVLEEYLTTGKLNFSFRKAEDIIELIKMKEGKEDEATGEWIAKVFKRLSKASEEPFVENMEPKLDRKELEYLIRTGI